MYIVAKVNMQNHFLKIHMKIRNFMCVSIKDKITEILSSSVHDTIVHQKFSERGKLKVVIIGLVRYTLSYASVARPNSNANCPRSFPFLL